MKMKIERARELIVGLHAIGCREEHEYGGHTIAIERYGEGAQIDATHGRVYDGKKWLSDEEIIEFALWAVGGKSDV